MTIPRLILCKASAGSGKTFTLAKTFVRIVLERPKEYDRILAVTFTNKATEEMKSRILRFLTDISRLETEEDALNSNITQSLLAEMPDWDYLRLKLAAREALSHILHDYSHFSIMTIDSFFQRLVKSFIHELKLSYVAGVSMDTDTALDRAVGALIDSYNQQEDNPLNRWLRDISLHRMDEGDRWHPADTIKQISKELFKEKLLETGEVYPVEKVEPLYHELRKIQAAFRNKVRELAQEVVDIIHQYRMEEVFSRGSLPKQAARFLDGPDAMQFTEPTIKQIQGDGLPIPVKNLKGPDAQYYLQAWSNHIQPACQELVTYHQQNIIVFNTAKAILLHLQSLALLSAVKDKIREYREQEQVMLISDNTQLINRIVSNTDAPFLFEKLGNRYRYIMLDEFQDTSTLQWQNLLPLLMEALAHRDNCKVLIVGDAKQSIYRWRNGNLRLILQQVKTDLGHVWQDGESEMLLDSNFRSKEEVVRFNNELFGPLSDIALSYLEEQFNIDPANTFLHGLLADLFRHADARQQVRKKGGGFVSLQFFTREQNKNQIIPNEDGEPMEEDAPRVLYLKNLLKDLMEVKNFKQGDICILVRQNHKGAQLADLLTDWGYQVNTAEALYFNKHAVIQLLLHVMRYLSKPGEDLYAVALAFARSRINGQQDVALLNKTEARKYLERHFYELSDHQALLHLKSLPLSELVLELIRILQLDEQRDIYTEQFLDQVRTFASGISHTTLEDFLEWWDLKERSIQSAGNLDAIQIMTIHKSKGLEFPVVILPFTDWKLVETDSNKASVIWPEAPELQPFDKFDTYPIRFTDARDSLFEDAYREEVMLQAADNLNLTYVAFTRAAEQLYVMAEVAKDPDKRYSNFSTIGKLIYATLQQADPSGWEDDMLYKRGVQYGKEVKADNNQISEARGNNGPQSLTLEPRTNKDPHAIGVRVHEPYSDERIIGQAVHDMAARYRMGMDVEALTRYISISYALTDEQQKDLFSRMNRFLQAPPVKEIYQTNWQIITERQFYYKGQLLRFDLLLTDGRKGHLYDLKTGGEEAENIQQLQLYREGLEATGLNIEQAALIYIDPVGNPYFKYL